MQPNPDVLQASISATTENGKELLEDAKFLFDFRRFSTALALAVLAHEEFAKAFLLQLVADGSLPWVREVQQSMARHECKRLLGLVMEWLPNWDSPALAELPKRRNEWHEQKMAWLQRRLDRYKQGNFVPDLNDPEPVEPDISFPPDVATALNIYRHEKIERLRRVILGRMRIGQLDKRAKSPTARSTARSSRPCTSILKRLAKLVCIRASSRASKQLKP